LPVPSVNSQLALRFEPEKRIFAVSELNGAIRDVFSREFRNVWVTGEVSGCKVAASGHLYFALKDGSGQIRCVLFKGTARWLKFRPQDGLAVLARGSVDVYEQRGEYQLIIDQLEPQGAGALQLAFEQLKRKLEAEGFFAQERKRPLPKLPKRIGIVTSPAGSVIRDILHVLQRRFPGLHIRLFPALVQGAGSIEQVCAGITHFSETDWAEVIIVARGGGSLEDLWTFNEEAVARAIAACRVPVISAIGHETDFTIADFVADLRAPTPSAAAELVVTTRDGLLQQLRAAEQRSVRAVRYQLLIASRRLQDRGVQRAQMVIHRTLARRAQQVDDCDFRLQTLSRQFLRSRRERLDHLRIRLNSLDLRVRFARAHTRLENAESVLARLAQIRLWKSRTRCEELHAHLSQLSPLAVLGRGYALVQNAEGKLLRSSDEAHPGEAVAIRLSRGGFSARVEEIDRFSE
jgi:exodeoxyribonuclease VII large subunit